MGINILWAYLDDRKRAAGETIPDPEKQYKMIKADMPVIEEQYRQGNVPESVYLKYVNAIKEWERM